MIDMPDISKCLSAECPSSSKCYRFTSKPSYQQAYALYEFDPNTGKCDNFWDISDRDKIVREYKNES